MAADFRPEAKADVLHARKWYEEQQPGLGEAFADSLDDFVNRISSMPLMYPVAHRNVRRGKLRRFPYVVYYRLLANRLEILAVLHGSRDPRVWRERIQ